MDKITTLEQLFAMKPAGQYELLNDIDCQGQIIKCLLADFKGTINGNGYTISNLCIEETAEGDTQPIALFHTLRKAIIRDVIIDNLSMKVQRGCFRPNIAALCVECSNSVIQNVEVRVINANKSKIPLIYDSNDNEISNASITCNGNSSIIIKYE